MSDRRTIEAGALWLGAVLVAKADGSAITTGTVNAYVLSKDGTNSGKWYRNSDSTWQASETANATAFGGGAQWSISFTNSPFADGLHYEVYFKESGALHVPTGYLARCEYTPSADSSRRIDMGKHLGTVQSAGRDLGSVLPSAAVNAAGGLRAPVVAAGTCQAGSSTTTINLAAGTTAVAVGDRIRLLSGTGSPAEAPITGTLLGGSPPSVSVASGWITNAPTNTTTYIIMPGSAPLMSTAGYSGLDALGTDTQNGKEDLGIPAASDNATAVWANGTRSLTDKAGFSLTVAYDAAKTAAQAGDQMALTSTALTAIAAAVEGHLIDEADGQQLLTAIVAKINSTDVNLAGLSTATIASAVWAYLLSNMTTPNSGGAALAAIFGKLPVNNIADETLLMAAVGTPMQAGTAVALAASQPNYAPAKAGDAMALTSGERTTLATSVNTTLTGSHGTGSWQTGSGGSGGGDSYTIVENDYSVD
jgi:hypothetical protein